MPKEPQFDFRVIAGELKGKRIVSPDLGITRPPLSRVRKAIFDYLTPYLEGAAYLDLFSGTGSYLFEAVSRGAKAGTGVEHDMRLADAINTQAKQFGVADRLNCVTGDVFKVVPTLKRRGQLFDIIMMAPPQYKGIIDKTLTRLGEHHLLTPDGQLLCQHDTSETDEIVWAPWRIVQQRKYGNTTFTILAR
jgi:16S rRNA (guanine(966)-N(2))-methyltransferase RsmD